MIPSVLFANIRERWDYLKEFQERNTEEVFTDCCATF